MFLLILNQLLKMLFIMILAFICYRIKLINQEGNKNFSDLLLMVVNPCVILSVYQMDYDPEMVRSLLVAFAAAIIAHVIGILIAHFIIPEQNNPDYAVERFSAVYSNCGFIGIPLINSVLGSQGVFFLTAYMTVFNILCWTHGLSLLNGKFTAKRLKEGLLSPLLILTVVSLIMYLVQIRIPDTLLDAIEYVADMNTPLAMMIAGFSVAQSDFKKIFTNIRVYWVSLIKLIIIPLAVLLFLVLAGTDQEIAYTTLIAAACPTGATVSMMAIRYDKNYKYASEIFSVTTILCIITIPLIVLIAQFVL